MRFFRLCWMILISNQASLARPTEFSKPIENSCLSMTVPGKSSCNGELKSNIVSKASDVKTPSLFYVEPNLSLESREPDPYKKSIIPPKGICATLCEREKKLRQITSSLSTSSMMNYLCRKAWSDNPESSLPSRFKNQNSGQKISLKSATSWPRRAKSSICFFSRERSSVSPSEVLEVKDPVKKLETGSVLLLDRNHRGSVDKETNKPTETRNLFLHFDAPLKDMQKMAKEYGLKSYLSLKVAIGITELSWNMIQQGIKKPEWEKTLPKIYEKPFFLTKRLYDLKIKRFNDLTILWIEDYRKYGLEDILQEYSNGMSQALSYYQDQAFQIGYERFLNYFIPRISKLQKLIGSQEKVLKKMCEKIEKELKKISS
ncbi:hypothetical protein DFH28DRAFT_966054 [Melampsora americana]|nr:hypothetical protein DFH28DRAFT_966054 [Melampsora americana]